MKLKDDYLAIQVYQSHDMRQDVVSTLMSKQGMANNPYPFTQADIDERQELLTKLMSNQNHKLYYISPKVQDHAELIKYEKVNMNWFRDIKEKSGTYIINKTEFFRFYIHPERIIHIAYFKSTTLPDGRPYVHYDIFGIRLNKGDAYMAGVPGQDETAKQKFIKLLLFIELSEIVFKQIKPFQKTIVDNITGGKYENKIINQTGYNVIFVGTNWNKTIIVSGQFSVSGHIRIQPFGTGRSHYKPIWIEEYQKSGYMKKAPKLNN